MAKASRDFQVFVKPGGPACNLACAYCYYVKKDLPSAGAAPRMPDDLLEAYIVQHIAAAPGPVIRFSWHGGEPTLLGLDFFRRIVDLQRRHRPRSRQIANGIQTNGTLLNEPWCRFLAAERFFVGLSLDGTPELHDLYRRTPDGRPTHARALRGFRLLQRHGVPAEILCVVHGENVRHAIAVYRFFREIGARHITLLPLVEALPDASGGVGPRSVPAEAWGDFLCTVFDEWQRRDIGRVQIQIFEETARTALGQEQALCIFRKTCGDIPVVEHNGDVYACDHFVDRDHRRGNIRETPLADLLGSAAQRAFGQAKRDALPRYCRACEVLRLCHGGCPKDRILRTPDGEAGLNVLCAGYKRFFLHCRPFLTELGAQWRRSREKPPLVLDGRTETGPKIGRNDPCPCGSGRKYKKCCLGR